MENIIRIKVKEEGITLEDIADMSFGMTYVKDEKLYTNIFDNISMMGVEDNLDLDSLSINIYRYSHIPYMRSGKIDSNKTSEEIGKVFNVTV